MDNKSERSIYLASASPRRKSLLGDFGYNVIVIDQTVQEITDQKLPSKIVKSLAKIKMGDLFKKLSMNIVVSADTIVWRKGQQYGKPKDEKQAKEYLSCLSGKWHKVYTGVCVSVKSKLYEFCCVSRVKFKKLSQQQIDNYINTKKPMDKAGAYGIQDQEVVEKYKGSYSNIVGLPMEKLTKLLNRVEEK